MGQGKPLTITNEKWYNKYIAVSPCLKLIPLRCAGRESKGRQLENIEMKKLLMKLWYWLTRGYPLDCPLLYVCSHNGVTGVVRAEDYDREIRRMRRWERKHAPKAGKKSKPFRPQVYPVFLFSDKLCPERNLRVGSIDVFRFIACERCVLEERSFFLPPLAAGELIPRGYDPIDGWEQTGREGCRATSFTFEQARTYLTSI